MIRRKAENRERPRRKIKRAPSVEDLIVPVHETGSALSALIYGRSGTGKTHLAGTFPKPLLLLDVREHGTDTIKNISEIDVIDITQWSLFENVYWHIKKNQHEYKTIVIDQVTAIQEMLIENISGSDPKTGNRAPMNRSKWGKVGSELRSWFHNYVELTQLGTNVAFIAHERIIQSDEEDDDIGQIDPYVIANLIPSVSNFLAGAVDLVGHTFIRESFEGAKKRRYIDYCLRVGPNAAYTTKIRRPAGEQIPEYISDPTFDEVTRVIRGNSKPRRRRV